MLPRSLRILVPVVAAAACSDVLTVRSLTLPDIDRVFATPAAIEQAVASGYQSCHNAVEKGLNPGSVLPQLAVLSLEGYATVANYNMGALVGIPRSSIANGYGSYADSTYGLLALGARLAANAVTALDRAVSSGATLGTKAQNLRARAFGFLAVGCHQGWLAMTYDSAAIVTPGMAGDLVPPLSGAKDAMKAALAMIDSAIAIAADPLALGTGGFPLPSSWMGGNALSRDEFLLVARSLRARFRAGVARTPAERAAVAWDLVIADATNGITTDFTVSVSTPSGWLSGLNVGSTTFFFMSPMLYGMADVSGGYDAWLARPLDQRDFFLIVTPDRRWPQGTTRQLQQTNSPVPTSFASRPYVNNRTGADPAGLAWGVSYYFFNRLAYIRNNSNTGAFPAITKAEMDLLAAEGYLRAGNISAAASRIDVTRVARGQLPALSGVITGAGDPVPGGSSCVPRVPAAPAYTSTKGADIWEAMKWEKRMETAFTGFGQWFFDSRGWGDLAENTAIELPVPNVELAARRNSFYSLGGGSKSSAAKGTYGF